MNIFITRQLEKSLLEYRRRRKVERGGKMITNQAAITELLDKALSGIEPAKVIDEHRMKKTVGAFRDDGCEIHCGVDR